MRLGVAANARLERPTPNVPADPPTRCMEVSTVFDILKMYGTEPCISETNGVRVAIHSWPRAWVIATSNFNMGTAHQLLESWQGVQDRGMAWEGVSETPAERSMEFAGRVCYMSFGEKQGRIGTTPYLRNIILQGHGQLLEHAVATVVFDRCSRGFTHQMVRHRAGFSYSQESTHFIDYSEGRCEMAVCGFEQLDDDAKGKIIHGLKQSLVNYSRLVEHLKENFTIPFGASPHKVRKLRQGMARDLLPSALQARLVVTANHRSWRWFCELRGAKDNTPEIRCCAAFALEMLRQSAPTIYETLVADTAEDGFPYVRRVDGHKEKV